MKTETLPSPGNVPVMPYLMTSFAWKHIIVFLFAGIILLSLPATTHAVPSYARQTNMSCVACHTVFPELNTFGRIFKLNGYTLTGIKTIEADNAKKKSLLKLLTISPLSAMGQVSYTHLNGTIPETQNDNFSFPQQLSLFYAGQIAPHLGTFIQITYDDQGGTIAMDNADIRYSNRTSIKSKDLLYGFTLNNNPTVQDVWNTTPAWGFPYAASSTAPSPAAATMIEGELGQSVAGLGAYAFLNNLIYAEVTMYRSAQQGAPNPPDSTSTLIVKGVAPYWRAAIQHQWEKHYLEVGTFGISAKLYPMGISGTTDRFTDVAADLQYQYTLPKGYFTLHSSYVHEKQDLAATYETGGAENSSYGLNSFKIDGNIYFQKGIVLTLGYFLVSGGTDTGLYGPGPVDGSRLYKPNSDGLIAQVDYLPWYNTKLSLQYTMYNKFNGAVDDYDGFSRKADANNTLYLSLWVSF